MSHKPYWTPGEKKTALDMRAQGFSDWEISVRIGRTKKAVNAFLACPARQHSQCKRQIKPALASGDGIGICKEDREARIDAIQGSQRLLDALLAVHA